MKNEQEVSTGTGSLSGHRPGGNRTTPITLRILEVSNTKSTLNLISFASLNTANFETNFQKQQDNERIYYLECTALIPYGVFEGELWIYQSC